MTQRSLLQIQPPLPNLIQADHREAHSTSTRLALAAAVFIALAEGALAGRAPIVIDLGTLGGRSSYAQAVNATRQVVGASQVVGNAAVHAFSWTSSAGMIDLGTLGGTLSAALAVSDSGQVVGWGFTPDDAATHAFSWTPSGGMIDLGTLGGRDSYPVALNANGWVVGNSNAPNDVDEHAFLWTPAGGMIDLGTLGGAYSGAFDVNANGWIVGNSSTTGDAATHPFLWTPSGGIVDLGTLGGTDGYAVAVNANGWVIGNSTIAGHAGEHAFLWTPSGGMIDLGTLGGASSNAFAVNANGWVVGSSSTPSDLDQHAFLWTPAGGMIDLGTLGGSESFAMAVNSNGQIVGESRKAGSTKPHAFSWTPAGGMIDLGTLGGSSSSAVAVNAKGAVVGHSETARATQQHAALWRGAVAGPALLQGLPLAGPEATFAATPDGRARPSGDELSPRVAAPFRLTIRALAWNGDPHAMPHGRAMLEAGAQLIWELADVSRAAASADGSTVALLTRDHHVFVSSLPETPRQLDDHEYLSPRLSSDGTLLVAQRLGEGGHILEKTLNTQGIALASLASGESRLILEGNDLHSPSFASDEMVFFGSGEKEQVASLYLLDLGRMRVARATNRETGALQTFPSGVPRLAQGRIVYGADGERFDVPAPLQGDFGPLQRFEAQKAVIADAPVQPEFGAARLRRPSVQVKQPKVYQYYDLDRSGGRIRDWGCLQRTYDQHQGTDFNQAYGHDVVAPASGSVIYRYDGCADSNSPGCGLGFGNHVAIRHADGTVSLLAHGRKGTVVGFGTYACGAVLMQSANSGNSNAYHIHHEAWKTSVGGYNAPRFDPFQGTCDAADPSKWSIQNPYGDLPGTTCTN